MRRLTLVVGAFASLAVAIGTAPARAGESQTVVVERDYASVVENPCSGNVFYVKGTYRQVLHITVDSSGNEHLHVLNRFNAGALADVVTGEQVRYEDQTNTIMHVRVGGSFVMTAEGTAVIAEPRYTFVMHTTARFIVDTDGNVSQPVFNFKVRCAGQPG